jgi:hypothetical protein
MQLLLRLKQLMVRHVLFYVSSVWWEGCMAACWRYACPAAVDQLLGWPVRAQAVMHDTRLHGEHAARYGELIVLSDAQGHHGKLRKGLRQCRIETDHRLQDDGRKRCYSESRMVMQSSLQSRKRSLNTFCTGGRFGQRAGDSWQLGSTVRYFWGPRLGHRQVGVIQAGDPLQLA